MTPTLDTPARHWHVLSDADLARLRYSLIQDLARLDRERREPGLPWLWHEQHAMLLTVKRATALAREEGARLWRAGAS